MREINKDIYIHIGYPKTGTTTLQKYLFSKHSEIAYLRNYSGNIKCIGELFYSRELSFLKNRKIYQDEIKNVIKHILNDRHKIVLYSEESLLAFSMYFRFQPAPYIWSIEPTVVARKINYLFNDLTSGRVRIIVTIRRQDKLILSMYAQVYNWIFSKFKQTKNFNKFYEYILRNRNHFILDAIDFYYIIKYYAEIFGKDNVKVLIFEKLVEDNVRFYNDLLEFLGIDKEEAISLLKGKKENSRSSRQGYKTDERRLEEILAYYKERYFSNFKLKNKLIKKVLRPVLKKIVIPGKFDTSINMTEDQKKEILFLFKESNCKLDKEFSLDLKKYGYY